MKSVEEFQNTQKLIDEYNGFDTKVSELESKIEQNKKVSNLRIERLNEQLNITWEDAEFEIDRNSLQKEIENRISTEKGDLSERNAALNKEITEVNFDGCTRIWGSFFFDLGDQIQNLKKATLSIQTYNYYHVINYLKGRGIEAENYIRANPNN